MFGPYASRLNLESLDERLVPSATVLNLTYKGAVTTTPSGAIVEQIDTLPAGTGPVQTFVRIQNNTNRDGTEQGYNTDARPLQFDDEKKSPEFTHSITLGQVPVVTVNGVNYLEFFLGINQKASSPYLSLDEVQIYLGSVGNLTGYKSSTGTLAGLSPVFDLDSGGNVEVLLNAKLSKGKESVDMALLVPDSSFAGASPDSFLYLYSRFGGLAGARANGGFEQWSIAPAQPPSGGSLSGTVDLYGVNTGISDVTIELQGTDSQGNAVNLTTTTDANGAFTFTNLAAGTYSIIQEPPELMIAVAEAVGTVNGVGDGTADVPNTQFTNITLASGQNGIGYVFQDSSTG